MSFFKKFRREKIKMEPNAAVPDPADPLWQRIQQLDAEIDHLLDAAPSSSRTAPVIMEHGALRLPEHLRGMEGYARSRWLCTWNQRFDELILTRIQVILEGENTPQP